MADAKKTIADVISIHQKTREEKTEAPKTREVQRKGDRPYQINTSQIGVYRGPPKHFRCSSSCCDPFQGISGAALCVSRRSGVVATRPGPSGAW